MPKALAPLINAVGIRWDVELRRERSEVVIMMGGGTSWVPSSRSRCDVNVRRSPRAKSRAAAVLTTPTSRASRLRINARINDSELKQPQLADTVHERRSTPIDYR